VVQIFTLFQNHPFWNSVGAQLILELCVGIVGSFVFLFAVLLLLRPSIRICQVIAKQENTFDQETCFTFVFKIINRSWFDAFEIQLELFEVSFYPAFPCGLHKRLTEIRLKRNHLKQIPRRKLLKRNSQIADHCINFRTNIDLEAIVKNSLKAIQLQITLKHGLTGLSRVYYMDYRSPACIKPGDFEFGNKLGIK
jgi:hypothetical protein